LIIAGHPLTLKQQMQRRTVGYAIQVSGLGQMAKAGEPCASFTGFRFGSH
jgi:hypothetical protein